MAARAEALEGAAVPLGPQRNSLVKKLLFGALITVLPFLIIKYRASAKETVKPEALPVSPKTQSQPTAPIKGNVAPTLAQRIVPRLVWISGDHAGLAIDGVEYDFAIGEDFGGVSLVQLGVYGATVQSGAERIKLKLPAISQGQQPIRIASGDGSPKANAKGGIIKRLASAP